MAIKLATFMFWARMSQVASTTVILGTNGFLIRLIGTRKLGLAPRMIAIQNLAALVLFYTIISLLVLHIYRKSARTCYVTASIIGDLVFTGVCIAILSIYAIAGVPANCGGLTRENWNPGDAPNNPQKGFDTVRFGHGLYGSYGELDIYCDLPVADFAMTVILIFTYTLNIILSVLHILSFNYTHKSEVNRLIVEAEMKGKGSYSDLASLITRVASNSVHAPSIRLPPASPPASPAPSFHSSPTSNSTFPFSGPHSRHSSPPENVSPTLELEMSDLYLPDDADEIDMADGLVSNGSGGRSGDGNDVVPPPYMPDLEANRGGASASTMSLGRFGKDGEFPGLR
ncbi:hypothetical protein N431DRAFT_436427 [Stipitochalara longipes BDJ]|nr:hypothetical protein N431DRAFT_436427 [Stipitochalara longipes BDJ]